MYNKNGLASLVTQFPDVENVQRHFAATTTTTKIVAKILAKRKRVENSDFGNLMHWAKGISLVLFFKADYLAFTKLLP